MRYATVFLLLFGCGRAADVEPAELDSTSTIDEPEPKKIGKSCEPEVDVCEEGAACCTKCCADDEEPVCTVVDADGACPLPDLAIDADRIVTSVDVQDVPIEDGDCELVEGCVLEPGWRRVLRFGLTTPNQGTAHLAFGKPEDSPELFEFSECHEHFHFNGYASYQLLDQGGSVVASGHKQAFCLMDFEQYAEDARPIARYDCFTQGISVGWADTYDSYLECQWVDITDVPAGTYLLEVEINVDRTIPENDFSNNVASVEVVVVDPAEEPPVTEACVNTSYGQYRNCGWTVGGSFPCIPGEEIDVGCEGACDGTCSGDTVVRVCDGDGVACRSIDEIGSDDEADCSSSTCAWERGVTCPDSGVVTGLVAAWSSASSEICTLVAQPTAR